MYNEIEICYRHIDLVLSKMNELYSMICDGSDISKIFKENSTINNIEKLKTAIRNHNPLPKTNFSSKIFENEQILLSNKTIIYFLKYLHFTHQQILQYNETKLSGVFKCNQLLTIRFCHLITIFSKLVLFFSQYPICSDIALASFAYNNSKDANREGSQSNKEKMIELLELALECTSNNRYLSSCLIPVKPYIQNILSEIANTIIGFNNYNFEQFSIFYSEPPKMTTLPSLEYILMMNYSVIQDMLKIVFYTFNDLASMNRSLALSILSESKSIYLSSNIIYKFDDEQLIRNIFFQTKASDKTPEILLQQISIDSQSGHNKKIKYVLFLLKDYLNYAQFSFDIVMDNYVKLIALTNYAIYEISNILAFEQKSNIEINFVLELLTILVDLIDFMNSKRDDIKRYYLFNLATNDLHFLIEGMKEFQMIDSPSDDLLPMINFDEYNLNKKAEFLPIIYNELYLMAESLKIIDLEKFDSGENYSFLPFTINTGRLLLYFFKNMHNSSGEFINKILEHLNTILLHINFVENSYSSFCDFTNLSNFTEDLVSKCKNGKDLSINYYVSLIRILENLKRNEKISRDTQFKTLLSCENLAGSALTKSREYFQYILSNVSPFMNNSFSSTPISVTAFSFNTSKSTIHQPTSKISDKNLSQDQKRNKARLMRKNYELYDFYTRITQISESLNSQSSSQVSKSILDTLKKQIVKEAPLFAYHSQKSSNSKKDPILYANDIKKANFTLTEYFWPLFIILDLPFKRTMYNSRLNQSMVPSDSNFYRQYSSYNGNAGQIKTVEPKLFIQYSNYLEEFLNQKLYNKILYQTAKNGFFPSHWFSSAAIKDIIDDFGPYMALNLDITLTNHIVNSIINIYQNFYDNSSFVLEHYQKFKESSELPSVSEIEENILSYCDEVIKLGSAVAIRRLLRSQVALSCEENSPGFMPVIAQGIKLSLNVHSTGSKEMSSLSSDERILAEIFGGSGGGSRNFFLPVDDEFSFVRAIIQTKNLQQFTDFSAFCFYMALMMLGDNFNNIRLHTDVEAIDKNAHLFPVAMGAIVDCGSSLFACFDGSSIKFGLSKFLDTFSTIYRMRSNRTVMSPNENQDQGVPLSETLESLQFLATLFPKYIRSLEYERIEESLPLLDMYQILAENKKNKQLL